MTDSPRQHWVEHAGARLRVLDSGPEGAPALLLAHALGTSAHLWDEVCAALPSDLRLLRYDARGHGQSSAPDGPYKMGTLVGDAEAVLDALSLRDVICVGASLGGLVAQGLAAKRLDQVRALVLCNTAAKLGTRALWQARADAVRRKGIQALAPEILRHWLRAGAPAQVQDSARALLLGTGAEGYAASCEAIGSADFITPTSGLRLPALVIASSEDRATPPDMQHELSGLIPGSRVQLLRPAGHLPALDAPEALATAIADFAQSLGHKQAPCPPDLSPHTC